MTVKVVKILSEYYDSVRLMQTAEKVRRLAGVTEAMLMMGTDNNKRLLETTGLLTAEATQAGADQLIIAVLAGDLQAANTAAGEAVRLLKERVEPAGQPVYRTLDSALSAMPEGNLALISVPGDYAAAEARRALERNLNVMLFSDNVSLADEIALKQLARRKNLLMMGPDCGTALINGVGFGFANAVQRGPVGIVGASGTGIQQISVLLDRGGAGVSHAIGTGGRDLAAQVGGMMMLAGLELLEADPDTEVILLTSKPPDPEVSHTILGRVARCPKPVVVNFLGTAPETITAVGALPAETLADAATQAIKLLDQEAEGLNPSDEDYRTLAALEAENLTRPQQYLRGLFSGGTLGHEALFILKKKLGGIYANIAPEPDYQLSEPWDSRRHTLLDLGADEFTRNRAHPMIDPALRLQRLVTEALDPQVAVILLDVVLGYGAHPDPAAALSETITQLKAQVKAAGRYLSVVASVCGTRRDLQDLTRQETLLREAGVVVMPSNAQASHLAGWILHLAAEKEA